MTHQAGEIWSYQGRFMQDIEYIIIVGEPIIRDWTNYYPIYSFTYKEYDYMQFEDENLQFWRKLA